MQLVRWRMRVMYSDGQLMRWGGQVRLANLAGTWCVVGQGYICAVANVEEGNQVMAHLKADGQKQGILIDYEHPV